MISHFGFAAQRDLHDVFGFVIVKRFKDRGEDLLARRFIRCGHGRSTLFDGLFRRDVERQVIVPLVTRHQIPGARMVSR